MESIGHATTNQHLRKPISVAELMTAAPHTIGSHETLEAAHRVMRKHSLRHLPVLRGGRLVGVLSQRDLYFVESLAGVDTEIDTVTDAMSADVFTVAPGDCIRDVARTMAERKLGCAVVVDRGVVVGIFTATDALRHLAESLQ